VKKLFLLLSVLVFVGCKSSIEIVLPMSAIQNKESQMHMGNIYVEISGCNDYEDSRKPSSSLIEAQKLIPYLFGTATFVECFSKNYNSYAHFQIPIAVGFNENDVVKTKSAIGVRSTNGVLLQIEIPTTISQRILGEIENDFSMTSIDDFEITIGMHNDLGKDIKGMALDTYISGEPHTWSTVILESEKTYNFKLSNVSTEYALKNGTVIVLIDMND